MKIERRETKTINNSLSFGEGWGEVEQRNRRKKNRGTRKEKRKGLMHKAQSKKLLFRLASVSRKGRKVDQAHKSHPTLSG